MLNYDDSDSGNVLVETYMKYSFFLFEVIVPDLQNPQLIPPALGFNINEGSFITGLVQHQA